ncbi:protein obstructor-E-like [Limulus polyphemus]|uniref:Protein obstructor-E-like n=1 Tax=Limulus polyphemus TaxID=6850 RepID=A0ABM1BUS6_LIMPO|nr:protein obstructor-E-like [Limulus polyphemus]
MKVCLVFLLLLAAVVAQQRSQSQSSNDDYEYYYDYEDEEENKPLTNTQTTAGRRTPSTRTQSQPSRSQATSPRAQAPPRRHSATNTARRSGRGNKKNDVSTVVQTNEVYTCPELYGFFPHLTHCDRYWSCDNGTATQKLCGNGLVFDPFDKLTENCAYAYTVNCGDRTELEPPISTPHCPRLYGVFGDEKDCKVFYSCWNGEGSRYECPPGLAYDPDHRVCVWADNVPNCKQQEVAEGFVCPDPIETAEQAGVYTRHAHPTDCRYFFVCIEGVARSYGCGITTVFNAKTLQCEEPENVAGCENYYDDLEVDPKKLAKLQG